MTREGTVSQGLGDCWPQPNEAAEVPETYRPFLQAGLADTEAVEQEDLSVFTRGATLEPLVCQLVDCNR